MGARAGSMCALFPHSGPRRRNEGARRAEWARFGGDRAQVCHRAQRGPAAQWAHRVRPVRQCR
eukprot:9956360-Lingulodinium_polyedra.AAC.1